MTKEEFQPVQPKKISRWIDTHDATKCYCFNCNVRIVDTLGLKIEDVVDLKIIPPPYCPNCGAKMIEEQNLCDTNPFNDSRFGG